MRNQNRNNTKTPRLYILHDCIQSLLRTDFSPLPIAGSQKDGIIVSGNHKRRHLAAEASTSSPCALVNRPHRAPFCPQNPQLTRHQQRHLPNPIITASTLQSQSPSQRVTFQSRNSEEPDPHTGPQAPDPGFSATAKPGPPAVHTDSRDQGREKGDSQGPEQATPGRAEARKSLASCAVRACSLAH